MNKIICQHPGCNFEATCHRGNGLSYCTTHDPLLIRLRKIQQVNLYIKDGSKKILKNIRFVRSPI